MIAALRQSSRAIRQQPLSALVMAVTLAFGVGANTAMLGLTIALVFQPPPHVRDPSRLVTVADAANYVDYTRLATQTQTLDVASYTLTSLSAKVGPESTFIRVGCVTPTYFAVLATGAQLGRTFSPGLDSQATETNVVLGHGFWQRQFGGAGDAIGKTVALADRVHVVIGVTPQGFRGIEQDSVDAWILITGFPEACSFTGENLLSSSSGAWLKTIGRIREGVTIAQAESEVRLLSTSRSSVVQDKSRSQSALALAHDTSANRRSREALTTQWLLGGAVILLLVASLNVAGLLLVRTLQRRREFSIRFQLGATRAHVFGHLLVEQLWSVLLCCVPAMFVAAWTGALVGRFMPASAAQSDVSGRSIGLTALLGLTAGILAALPAAIQGSRSGLTLSQPGSEPRSWLSWRFRQSLLVAQIALAFALMVAASQFYRSLVHLTQDAGYDIDRLVVATFDTHAMRTRSPAERATVMRQLLERVRLLPIVESASLSSGQVLGSSSFMEHSFVRASAESAPVAVTTQSVSSDYFATVGTKIIRGRAFTNNDETSGESCVIISRALASRLWPGGEAVGRCLWSRRQPCARVVGVSESRRHSALTSVDEEVFTPLGPEAAFSPNRSPRTLLIRTSTSPERAVGPIGRAVGGEGAAFPALRLTPVADLADSQARTWRFGATVFGFFGILATALAGIGVYGSIALSVSQRTFQLGVRMALGATSTGVMRTVFRNVWWFLLFGGALGSLLAMSASRFTSSLLFEISPTDGLSYLAASVVVVVAGTTGGLVPALRAARIDPAAVLRQQ